MKSFLVFISCLLTGILFSQIEKDKEITKILCSPEFHGRGYVNGGDSIAAEFIASEFKKLNLRPLKKSYFQKFTFNVNTFPNEMKVKVGEKSLSPGVDFIVDPGSASSHFIWNPKTISLTTLLNVTEFQKEIKTILEEKKYNSIAINTVSNSKDTLKLIRGIGEELAQILPVIEVTNQKFTWSVSQTQLKFPYILVKENVFLDNQNWDIKIDAKLIESHEARNVIGTIKGKNKKKTIYLTAHYDHLGRMGQETYFPGGNDNASGTAMILSLARYYSENQPECNIVFVAFAGEEAGLIGSKYYTEHPLQKLSKINFLVNLDIMGSGEDGVTVVNATKFEKEYNLLVQLNEQNQFLKQVKKRGPAANSDHYWFTEKGVSAFFIYTMGLNSNYHDVFDKYEALSFSEFEDIKKLMIQFVTSLQ